MPCEIDNYEDAICTVLSATKFQITFNTVTSSSNTLVQGRTTSQTFKNPYSTRRISDVTVTHLTKCDAQLDAKTAGRTRFPAFLPAPIPDDRVKITSSSTKIGVTDAIITIEVKPSSDMRLQGRVEIKSPPWYLKEKTGQQGVTQDYYAESMINFDSGVKMSTTQADTTVTLTNVQFDQSVLTMVVQYETSQVITPNAQLVITINRFQNPVDSFPVSGFQVSTTDSLGFLIDQSSSKLGLSSAVNEPQTLNDVQIQMLGDNQGNKIGQISSLQKMSFSFSMVSPLEPFCYFFLEFPKTLTLAQNIQQIKGSGIFKPYNNDDNLNTGQYTIDSSRNTMLVEGCRLPDALSATPFGTLIVSFIKLPDYIQEIDPIKVKVYADTFQSNLVIDDTQTAKLDQSDLTPGEIVAELFKPSNYYASAENVVYSVYLRPEHGLTPESRIIIDMPELLEFNRTEGCSVALTLCDCELAPDRNRLTLTNIFQTNLEGGNLIKFILSKATNPRGSREAGKWSVTTETPIDGIFYIVDGRTYEKSFFAKSGQIRSSLTVAQFLPGENIPNIGQSMQGSQIQVSNELTLYRFEIDCDHDIPRKGKLIVVFPEETQLLPNAELQGLSDVKQSGNNFTIAMDTGKPAQQIIQFQVLGARNARSFQPTSSFYIATTDVEEYIIDSGGQDIISTANIMADFSSVSLTNLNKTNGATTSVEIVIGLAYPLNEGDILHLEIPDDLSFAEQVTCQSSDVEEIDCSNSERLLQVTFKKVNETRTGEFKFIVQGFKNPQSTEKSSSLIQFYTTDSLGFKSQTATPNQLAELFMQTEVPATINFYNVTQGTEEYSLEGSVTLQFDTVNPIAESGVIQIQWPEDVIIYDNTFCQITTYKQILRADVCKFDLSTRTLRIQNAFQGVGSPWMGRVKLYLSRVKNPETNENLKPYILKTFKDFDERFQVDELRFLPVLKCHWACKLCNDDKNYCTQCWDHKRPFMYQTGSQSSCFDECPSGWTSNGSQPPLCQRCDVSCGTCLDQGLEGDVGKCLTCAPGYNFTQKVGNSHILCLTECSEGWFDSGNGVCQPCSSKCGDCVDNPNNCIKCKENSALPVLYESKCWGECPSTHLDLAGECIQCESPCLECDERLKSCTKCDGSEGRIYRFGKNCMTGCPDGTKLEISDNSCSGCVTGCKKCDLDNPNTCYECQEGFLIFENSCYENCPDGTILSFTGDTCRRLSDLDTRLIYFPFLIIAILMGFVSWIGAKIKPHHLIIANFAIMLGSLEPLVLFVQVVLSFIYGTYAFAVPIILIWLGYVVTQIVHGVFWKRDILDKDYRLQQYQVDKRNVLSSRIRNTLAWAICWKFHKLLYSRFFGLKTNAFKFTHPKQVQALWFKIQIVNIAATWSLVILLNLIGLFVQSWGTQLYIMFIENIILAIIFIALGLYEHKRMLHYWTVSERLLHKQKSVNSRLHKNKHKLKITTQGFHENQDRYNFIFLQSKTEELLYVFGGRYCKSDFYDSPDQQKDERRTYSWPMSRHVEKNADIVVDDPPKPIDGFYFDNCYHEPVENQDKKRLKPLNGQGINKATQKGGPFDGDLKRENANLVTDQVETEVTERSVRKTSNTKARGRKNNYLKQIDKEDHGNYGKATKHIESDEENSKQRLIKRDLGAIQEEEEIVKEAAAFKRKNYAANIKKPTPRAQKPPEPIRPSAEMRNFNEMDVIGLLERDSKGNVIVTQNANGEYLDLNQRKVTQQGYLLDADEDIVAAQDPNFKMFSGVLGGQVAAPFSFERYNFNAFDIFGNFKSFKNERDVLSFTKITDKTGHFDSKSRQVNAQGLLINNGYIVSQRGRKLFDPKQLDKEGKLPMLYNYYGTQFAISDVMGTFRMTDSNQIIKIESKTNAGIVRMKDLSGHLVNEQGYLINQDGHIVNRKGKMLFSKLELKNGEFPKIFPFSKFNLATVMGTFSTGQDGKPILTPIPDSNYYQDDNGVMVNQYGYLVDEAGNVVDHNKNIMFEQHLLGQDGKLPSLFKNKRLFGGNESDDDLSNLLQQIEGEGADGEEQVKDGKQKSRRSKKQVQAAERGDKDSSYGSEMDASPSKYDAMNQRRSATNLKVLRSSNSLGRIGNTSSKVNLNKKLAQMNQSDARSSTSGHGFDPKSSSIRRKKEKAIKMVRVEQMFDSDVRMAQAYGGEAQPRVRMVPKRFQTTQRERNMGDTLRQSHYSNAEQSAAKKSIRSVTQQYQDQSMQQRRTTNQLEAAGGQMLVQQQVSRPYSPSNQAFSVKDRMQIRKQTQRQNNNDPDYSKNISDLDQELAELYQQDVDKFIDGSNFEVESLSGFSELSKGSFMSLSRHKEETSKTKQLEADYLRKLEEQKQKHQQQQQNHLERSVPLRLTGMSDQNNNNNNSVVVESAATPTLITPQPPKNTQTN